MLSAALGCSHGRVWPPVRPEALFFVLRPSPTWRPRLTQRGRGSVPAFPSFLLLLRRVVTRIITRIITRISVEPAL